MYWEKFELGGVVYRLDHLHPFSFESIVQAKDGKPEQRYVINVVFSLHCFTRKPRVGESISAELAYSDSRETRIFDEDRYQQTMRLPEVIRNLDERKCFHDNHGNFYVFEIVNADATISYYSVFFVLSKAAKKAGLNLYVTSAHMRPERPYAHSPKPIRFGVLVYNTFTGKKVKPAP